MNIEILRLTSTSEKWHKESVIELIWGEWSQHFDSFDELKKELHDTINNANFYILYAIDLDQNKICGTISLIENDLPSFSHFKPWLANFFVLEQYRGKSIGSSLYDALIKKAFQNYQEIYLYTHNETPYIKKGWKFFQNFMLNNQKQSILKLVQD